MIEKFKNSYTRLIILFIISFLASLHLLITPEDVNPIVIRMIGLGWLIESFTYILKIRSKKLSDGFKS
jgi:hypothetical protein